MHLEWREYASEVAQSKQKELPHLDSISVDKYAI